ncbi:MAG TPA: protein kinase [Pyrinomonadaceae bacterium]|nr:protein kinase [Pyrinomonadaceae bacterium]
MKKCPKCGVEYSDASTLCPADGVALETTDDALIGATLAGKYRIDARLNEGGMGSVYRGTHVLMDKTVAIKVLRPSLAADEKIVARFSREARAASKISHPNAISVTDIGEDNGTVFLVMEFLSGKTLKHVIREEGPLPLPRIVDIARQVGDALSAAHSQGVVHRDLKSDNIMLLDTTSVGDHAKVLDFGIAKIIEPDGEFDGDLTAPNLVIGTPQYMSPEQCSQDSEIDSRSDIYSLGVILYELLVGHVPFSGESATIVMMKHLQDPVPSVLEERNDVAPAVGRVIARAMAKVPGNRYQTVGELIEDLTFAAGMIVPVPVPPVTTDTTTSITSSTPGSVLGLSSPNDDADEVTVVSVREEYRSPGPQTSGPRRSPVTVPIQPSAQPASSGFNPWKILVPAGIAVIVIFGAFYAWTKISPASSNIQNTNQPATTLSADPNSQPVQPAQPPTGKAEQGLPSGGSVNPSANVNASPNANADEIQTPIADISPTANENANANANTNANANRKPSPLPEPTKSVVPPNVPPPSPAATKPPAPTPSPVQR